MRIQYSLAPGLASISMRKFHPLKPSPRFAYATLGLLFVNVSVGGVLTNFAAPPVLMVASPERWNLSSTYMFIHFGDKALLGIVVSCLCYGLFFRKELFGLQHVAETLDDDHDGEVDWFHRETPIPLFVTVTHLGFMAWTVLTAHYPPLFIGGFLFFLAFSLATHHQNPVELRGPVMVGFFLAGLVVHGGLQGWWLGPIISHLGQWALFSGATILTSFNDNAAITLLASQANGLTPALKYAVLSGAVTGGGLTVIANAPNPAGQSLLARFFGDGVSPLKLAAAAFLPTIIVAACFMCTPDKTCHAGADNPSDISIHMPRTGDREAR
jgi:Na+/H+ antiporter NhaD/arsenite permease-like protein